MMPLAWADDPAPTTTAEVLGSFGEVSETGEKPGQYDIVCPGWDKAPGFDGSRAGPRESLQVGGVSVTVSGALAFVKTPRGHFSLYPSPLMRTFAGHDPDPVKAITVDSGTVQIDLATLRYRISRVKPLEWTFEPDGTRVPAPSGSFIYEVRTHEVQGTSRLVATDWMVRCR